MDYPISFVTFPEETHYEILTKWKKMITALVHLCVLLSVIKLIHFLMTSQSSPFYPKVIPFTLCQFLTVSDRAGVTINPLDAD